MTEQFTHPIPDRFRGDQNALEFFRSLVLFLDDISSPDGALETGAATTVTVLTHSEKLDLITVTVAIDLDATTVSIAANTAALAALTDSAPSYTITNDATDRVFDANSAAGAITNPPTQAEVENIRDAVLEQADVLATVVNDLANKNVLGT